MNNFTVEVYKTDRRTKTGERLVNKIDYVDMSCPVLENHCKQIWHKEDGYRFEIHATYVTRSNAMTGEKFQERYDTPFNFSPSSETYWSM